jgi:hypothetical protein
MAISPTPGSGSGCSRHASSPSTIVTARIAAPVQRSPRAT